MAYRGALWLVGSLLVSSVAGAQGTGHAPTATSGSIVVAPGERLGPLALGMTREAVGQLGMPARLDADGAPTRVGPYATTFDASGQLVSIALPLDDAAGTVRVAGHEVATPATFAQLVAAASSCGPVEHRDEGGDAATCAQGGLRVEGDGPEGVATIVVLRAGGAASGSAAPSAPRLVDDGRRVRLPDGREITAARLSVRAGGHGRRALHGERFTAVALDAGTNRAALALASPVANQVTTSAVFVVGAARHAPLEPVRQPAARRGARGTPYTFDNVVDVGFEPDGALRVRSLAPSGTGSECTFGPDLVLRACAPWQSPGT